MISLDITCGIPLFSRVIKAYPLRLRSKYMVGYNERQSGVFTVIAGAALLGRAHGRNGIPVIGTGLWSRAWGVYCEARVARG